MEEAALPINYPYIIGLYLAVNAVPDLFIFIDGPDCATFKAEYIYGRHDLNSTLLNCAGPDRIVRPVVDVTNIVHDRTHDIRRLLRETCALPQAGSVMFASMPMATITGIQYDSIIRNMKPPLPKHVFELPPLSLSCDWLDGYAQVLKSLAAELDLEGSPAPGRAAVVGYFMDRNEKDHGANISQIEDMLRGISLEPASIWPSGRPVSHLRQAGAAGVVISLPHGREAARILASRTGAKLIETGIPFGFSGAAQWISEIASATGREKQASEYIDGELRRTLPGVKWLINRVFLGRRFFFGGDPHMMNPMRDFFLELGCKPAAMAAVAEEKHLSPLPKALAEDGVPCRFNMKPGELSKMTSKAFRIGCDIIVASDPIRNYISAMPDRCAVVPFGFANYYRHAIFDAPFLGFGGALHFIDAVANEIMRTQSRRDAK
ncbi:MAG: nitrogenase component 1 [bacterium]